MRESYAPWIAWALVVMSALAVIGLIAGAPLAWGHGEPGIASTVYEAFSPFCHQMSERSFRIDGRSLAVCTRCTGLYAGFALAALAYPLMRSLEDADMPCGVWLFLATVPMVFDFLLGYFGFWENTHFSRFTTGALLGAAGVFYIVPGIVAVSTLRWQEAE